MADAPQDDALPETPDGETLDGAPLDDYPTPDPVPDPGRNPSLDRLDKEIAAGRFPSEPHVTVLPHKADDTLRDLAAFAIISRLLFKNRKNADIITALRESGRPMTERTLQRLMKRADFQDYYERYRNQLMEPLDKQVRDDIKLTMPEAYATLVKLMRTSRVDKVRFDAALTILEAGGAIRKESFQKKMVFNVPADLQRHLAEIGKRVATPTTPALAPGPDNDAPSDS